MRKNKLLSSVLVILFLTSLTQAQTRDVGTFVGAVADEEGTPLLGAEVTALNVQTGLSQGTVTNANGRYRIERLPRGFYRISASLPGFKTLTREGLELWAGAELRVDFVLMIGRMEEEVTVIGVSPIVETTRTQVSTVITNKEILAYPQGNRNYLTLVEYSPGIQPYDWGEGVEFSVNGMRTQSNNFMIDGIENNDTFQATDQITSLPPEAIQEFRLISTNFSAEYGRNTGGIVNAVMKSGTNEVHGSAWVFYRGDTALFRSEDWLTHERPIFKRWQYGATLGGPIWKDKTFFFLSFEGMYQREEQRRPTDYFTQEAIASSQGFAREFFDYVGSAYPVPTYDFKDLDGDGVNDIGKFVWDGEDTDRFYNFGIKVDHIFGSKDRVTLRWLHNNTKRIRHPWHTLRFTWDIPRKFNTGGVTWLHLFSPTMYNELRVGYHSDYTSEKFEKPDLPGVAASYPFLSIYGGWWAPWELEYQTFQAVDILNFQAGNHSLKLGGELRFWRSEPTWDALAEGVYYFYTPMDFICGESPIALVIGADPPDPDPSNPYKPGDPSGEWKGSGTHSIFKGIEGGLFIQDDWRVSERLTLSFGLRWEYFGVPEETSGKGISQPAFGTEQGYNNTQAGNLDTTEGGYNREGIQYIIFDGRELNGKGLWDPYYKAFAPKFSFAYDLTGDGKTSLRGGAGISFDRTFNNVYENDRFNYPDFTFATFWGAPFPGLPPIAPTIPATIPLANASDVTVSLRWMDPHLIPQKAYNWMIGIQRELAPDASIEVNYTGSLGRNLGGLDRPNRITGDTLDGRADGINPYTTPSDVNLRVQNLKSDYHGLTVVLNKRFSGGWSWYSAYTLSSFKDQSSYYMGGVAVCHERPEDEWGPSWFDRRHRVVGGFVWDIPFFRDSENWFVRNVIAGWQVSGNFHYSSAVYWDVWSGSMYGIWDFNRDASGPDRPLWLGDDKDEIIKWDEGRPYLDSALFGIPNPPAHLDDMSYYNQIFTTRSFFRWFPTYNINISMQKYFTFFVGGREVTVQFIGEVFNLLKNTFWDYPNIAMASASFGEVTRKYGVREAQLSIRVMF